jgi:beta-lactamase class C
VPLKRIATWFGLGLVATLALWAASRWLTAPVPQPSPAQRFEASIGDEARGAPTIDYARLDERLRRLSEDPAMVGLAVGIVEGGQIRFIKGYGRTFAGGNEPVTTDTVFRWASLSKGVAADMVALLAHEGRLSLNDPVGRYAASLHLPEGYEQRAQVADLLSHQLGLFAHAQDSKLEDGIEPHYLRGTLATLHNICAPGACHAYQNVAYDAASEIVERLTGRPYGEVLRERLFAPLGMTGASTSRAGLMQSRSWARPHVGGHPTRPEEVNDIYYRVPAAGGVNGTIKDLSFWMMAQMGLAPEVLPPEVLTWVQTPVAGPPGATPAAAAGSPSARRPPATAWAGGCSIMPATASSAIMAGCAATAR